MRIIRTVARDITINGLVASRAVPRPLRWRLLKAWGMNIEHSQISPGGFYGGKNISIGEGTFLNYGVMLDNAERITIGKRCQIGHGVAIITASHEIGGPEQRGIGHLDKPVTIGDGTWIGARAVVLPGVTIGSGCVIAAGAVVTRDCEPNGMYAGVPAVRKSNLPN